jgi:hypothetical protein
MGNKKTATRRRKSAKIQPLRLQGAGANLFYVYSKLIESDRRSVEVLLDYHAFLPGGTSSYLLWDKWNESDRRGSYVQLLDTVSEEVADAWFDWAHEISDRNPSEATCKKAVLDVKGELVRLKFLESLFQQGVDLPRT